MRRLVVTLCLVLGGCALAVGQEVRVGMTDTAAYLPLLRGRRVAVLANHTAVAGASEFGPEASWKEKAPEPEGPAVQQRMRRPGETSGREGADGCGDAADPAWAEEGRRIHLVDLLCSAGCDVRVVFAPEHGFRGTAGAGEAVRDGVDAATGVPVRSLYDGRQQRPADEVMRSFDVLVVDMQDVGLRFYTYYISMIRMMDACAAFGRQVVVLDRPNPNGHVVDGPVLDMKYRSGVGALPVPVLHGMTLGELARMAVGEGWVQPCALHVVPCRNYTHATSYVLPVPPSPNLRTQRAVYLYASLCLFEGTVVSVGRGTDKPFEVYGHPTMTDCAFAFTPRSVPQAPHPPHEGKVCWGVDLSSMPDSVARMQGLNLEYVVAAYRNLGLGDGFFTPMFEKLAGTDYVRRMIRAGCSATEIRAVWRPETERFRERRRPYLLYD